MQEVSDIKFINFGSGLDQVSFIDAEARLPIDVLDYSTISADPFEVSANKIYKFGTRDYLSVVFLTPEDETKANIYNFSFVAGTNIETPTFYKGSTSTEISIDKGTVEFVPGNKYEVSYNWASEILIVQ